MSDLAKRLRIKAGMIEMGEMIAWGSDSALMREAADALEMAAPAVQGEPVGWQYYHNGKWWRWASYPRVYAAPQPAEQQQPCRQSPPDDPLGGLEHRADGEANFHTLSRPTGSWVARIQFNGELHTHEQERILNAMLGDRNVRYGDGYHQGYWDARQESPDVAALEAALMVMTSKEVRLEKQADAITMARAALAAYRKQGGQP